MTTLLNYKGFKLYFEGILNFKFKSLYILQLKNKGHSQI